MRERYAHGLDVLGDGLDLGSFVPWLGTVGKMLGTGGTTAPAGAPGATPAQTPVQQQVQQLLEQERAKQALAKIEADAARTRLLVYGLLGAVGVGVALWAIKK